MKVKVIAEGSETQKDLDDGLFKAVDYHASGDAHMRESFDDPAMVDLSNKLAEAHEIIYQELLQEVQDELDKEYLDEY